MAAKVRYLLTRDGRHFARLGVPEALRPVIGKRELLEPLGSDRRTALRKLPAAVAGMQARLDEARDKIKRPPPAGRPLSVPQLARLHYDAELQMDTAGRNVGPEVTGTTPADYNALFADGYLAVLKRTSSGAATNEEMGAAIGWAINQYHRRGNTRVAPDTLEWRALGRALAGAQIEAITRGKERDQGNEAGQPVHPMLIEKEPEGVSAALRARMIGPNSSKPLSEIVTLVTAEKGAKSATNYEYETAVRMFEEHLGEAKPVYKITRLDVLGYKDALLKTPSNYTKRFPDTPLPDAIRKNEERKVPFPTLNVTTINDKWLPRLSSILKWSVNNSIIPDNPASGVKVARKKGEGPRSWSPFTPGDLTRIFAPPLFGLRSQWGERQWMLLIALFTGMRASELAQIRLDSVRHERNIVVFAVEEETKNFQSQRLVPVHSKLIALGLLELVSHLRKQGETHLFPDWYAAGQERLRTARETGKIEKQPYSQFLPRWFLRTYMSAVGIEDSRKKFHSFRHTLKTALSRAGVARSISDDITGHDDSSSGGRYIHETSIEAMKDALETIKFDGFEIAVDA